MSLLKRLLGGGRAEAAEPPAAEPVTVNAYATVRSLPALEVPHTRLNARDLSDPELAPHLQGFTGYVMSRGDGQMTAQRYHLWRHIQRVRNQLSFTALPYDLPRLEAWALAANAVLFLPDGAVRAPDGAVLIGADGSSDSEAVLPYPADAIARRTRTLERLSAVQPMPPASMPPSLGEAELVLPPAVEVLRRALALLHVAAAAEAKLGGTPRIPAAEPGRNPLGTAALTPRETQLLDSGPEEDVGALTWRYEAANTLLWALALPAAQVADAMRGADVAGLWQGVAPLASDPAAATLSLRPPAEILDALDMTWRQHWSVRQARVKSVALVGVDGDVVAERHAALNWLTGFHNDHGTGWDEIDTPT